jgi:4-amino-4-deoxy-L-arabinose transferase-like glycosyltransferase
VNETSTPRIHKPEDSLVDRLVAIACLILTFLYLYSFRRHSFLDLDEGIILQGAQRILDGQVLYRDFFAFVTPGSYYLLALVFRIFGDSYVTAHVELAAVGAVFSPITYLLSRRVCSRQSSLLVTALMAITAVPVVYAVLHNWDSTLWASLAVYGAVRWLESPGRTWAFATGSFTALTVLFEQSKGAGLLLGMCLGFIIIGQFDRNSGLLKKKSMMAFAVGLVWPVLLTFAYFASKHALGIMLYDWFWPLQHYSQANNVPFGYGNMSDEAQHVMFGSGSWGFRLFVMLVFSETFWLPIFPILGTAFLLRILLLRWRGKELPSQWQYYVLISAVIVGLLLSIMAGRVDYFHFMYLQPIFFLVFAWLLDGHGIRNHFFARVAPVFGFCLTMSLLAIGAEALFQGATGKPIPTRRGVVTMVKDDQVIPRIQDYAVAGEKILVYPYLSTYYYLTQTYSPTRYEFYQPGMHTFEQLDEMVRDFSAHPTRLVLYEPGFVEHIHEAWPNTPAVALVRDPMADYIVRAYHSCGSLTTSGEWHFQFMLRNDLPCPSVERSSR